MKYKVGDKVRIRRGVYRLRWDECTTRGLEISTNSEQLAR